MRASIFFAIYHMLLFFIILFITPFEAPAWFATVRNYSVGFALYALPPMFFFSLIVAVVKLLRHNNFFSLIKKLIVYSLLFLAIALIVTNLIEILYPLEKLPFIASEEGDFENFSFAWQDFLSYLLKPASFLLSEPNGFLLFSLFILALLFASLLSRDSEIAAPVYNLCDSLSRIFYQLNGYLCQLFFIPLTFFMLTDFIQSYTFEWSVYLRPLLFIVFVFLLLTMLCFPLSVRLLHRKSQPYRQLLKYSRTLITAFISGESQLVLSSLIYEAHHLQKLSREQNAFTTPLLFLSSRIGSIVMTILAFSIVYASQNRWPISFGSIFLWRMLLPCIFALIFIVMDSATMMLLISSLFTFYGEELYYSIALLLPLYPLIQRLALMLDVIAIVLINYLLAGHEKPKRPL